MIVNDLSIIEEVGWSWVPVNILLENVPKDSYHNKNAPLPQGLARACQESHGVGGGEIESQTQT